MKPTHRSTLPGPQVTEARYRTLFERAPIGILYADADSRYIDANDTICRMLGYSRAELVGMSAVDIVAPGEQEHIATALADIDGGGSGHHREWRLRRKDGTLFTAEVIATQFPDGTLLGMIQDVDAPRQRERTLRSEQQFSDTMLESMPGIVYFYDSRGRFLRWNRNFETVSGYSAAEIATMHPLDFFAPQERPLLESRIQEVFERGESSVEAPFLAKDGTTTPYFFTGRRVSFEGRTCLVGVGIDIADRRRAEDRLIESERQYRELVEHANSIILRWSRDGRITFMNEFGQRFFGYPAAEIVGRHIGTIVPLTESGGRDLSRLVADLVAMPESFEQSVNENLRRDGSRVWVAWTNRIVRDAAGQVVEMLSVGSDITERRQTEERLRESEERFRELAETVQEVFWMIDPAQGRMLYVSPAYEKIWGRSRASLYESPDTWREAIHPEDRERMQQAVKAQLVDGEREETYRIIRPDGAVRWIRDRSFPVLGAAGELRRIVGTAEDVTEQRQLEEQFRQAQKMEAIGQLAGGVAHDFNNILGAILGNARLALADTDVGHPARESLDEILRAGKRGTNLVQQILAFARHQPQRRSVIGLAPILRESYSLLRATIPAVVDLAFSLDDDAPPVFADGTQVYQAVANLCTNSWHALEGRAGRIEVRLEAVTLDATAAARVTGLAAGRFARVTVTDNGNGMDAATLGRIFEPFFTTKEPGKGTGLGLSVVHGIVRGHGGGIAVTSQPGRGTTFHLYFPAVAPAEIPVVAAVAEPAPNRGRGQHILYLDDEEPLVFLAKRVLQRQGYRVSGFVRAADALSAFRADPQTFDLVVTDLNMPGLSGMQVAAEVMALRPSVPVVLCSGHVADEMRQQALAAGVRAVLYKPNSMDEFGETIARLLDSP